MNTKFAAVTGLGDPGGFCELAVINQAPTGVARLLLATQNSAGGSGELVALANGGVQLNALKENIALNTTGGTANLVIEPKNTGEPLSATEAQEPFDGVESRSYDRVDGAAKQTGFVAQEVYKSGPLGKSFCKLKNFEDRELMTLDYQRMTAVLWQTRRRSEGALKMAEQEAIGLLEQLARDFNVRDPRKLQQIAREFPDRRDLTAGGPAERRGQAGAGPQAQEPGEERGGGAGPAAPGGPGGLLAEHVGP